VIHRLEWNLLRIRSFIQRDYRESTLSFELGFLSWRRAVARTFRRTTTTTTARERARVRVRALPPFAREIALLTPSLSIVIAARSDSSNLSRGRATFDDAREILRGEPIRFDYGQTQSRTVLSDRYPTRSSFDDRLVRRRSRLLGSSEFDPRSGGPDRRALISTFAPRVDV